jgi:microcin C transport system substrate-binding protein
MRRLLTMSRAIIVCVLVLLPWSAMAQDSHGIAMHGEPKYPANFKHFDYVNPDAPKGGTMVLSRVGSFDSVNPFIIKGVPAQGSGLVYERLLVRSRDEPFTLYARIAKTVDMPEDRSSVTFTLRPEARFHDGTPILASDIAFTYRTLKEEGRTNHRLFYKEVSKVDILGSRKIRFSFRPGGNRELPMIIGLMPVLSEAYYKDIPFNRTTLVPPLGSGPYKLVSVEQGRSVTYRRVDDYWGRDLAINRGRHNIDVIRYDYYRDQVVALEAFKAGLIDLRHETDPGRWTTAYESASLTRGEIIKRTFSHSLPGGMKGFVFNTRRTIFKDRNVRRALAFAFNFEWINRNFFHNSYERTESYFSNSELAAEGLPSDAEINLLKPFQASIPPEVFSKIYSAPKSLGRGSDRQNYRTAIKQLRRAGWKLKNKRMIMPAGEPAKFEILLVNPRNERLALAYARKLNRLGIEASVRTVDSSQYQFRLNAYDYDMIIYWWDESLSPGNEQAFYWSSQSADTEGTRNYAGIKSPAVDALIQKLVSAKTRSELVTATRAMDRILQWGHYVVPLFHLPKDRVAYWNKFGFPLAPPLQGYQLDTWWHKIKK